jgi:hypothetical protein
MRKGRICGVLICLVVMWSWEKSEGQTTVVGARSVSLAGISAGLEDALAVFNNPAGIASYKHYSVATTVEQRYLLKETGQYGIVATIPVKNGCIGVSSLFSGYRSFIDQKFSLGYGRLFGKHFLTGLSLVYVFQKAGDESRPIHQVSYEIGTIALLSEKLNLAFTAFNPFQIYFKSEDYATLPSIFRLGLSYKYNPEFIIHTELEKDLDFPALLKIGMEYTIRNIFALRGGISGFPVSYSFGTAIRHERLMIELASAYHQYLGFTPHITLQFDFK